ncbi:MAG TPA: tetratricopeptide repeat protein [Bacteroidales bacterium]|nr:tetratricopeptide repeat protein [Bacteroidales bacterium]
MKRFILSLLIAVISIGAFAQKGKVASGLSFIDAGNLDKAKDAIDAAVVHEKTKDWPKTYYAKGRLAQALYETNDDKYKAMYDDILMVAYDNYKKSIELDDKDSMEKLVILQLPQLSNDFLDWAVKEFDAGEYEKSLKAFEELIVLQGSDIYVGTVDTAVIFNAGLAAYNSGLYNDANAYFDRSIEMGYEGTTSYILKYQGFVAENDLVNAEKTLTTAFEAFPTDQNLLLQLIQFYLANEMDENAYDYITMAKESDPDNYTLYWAEGVLLLKQEKYDEAIVALERSIEINSEFFETQYNLGVCYYNKASGLFNEANEIMDNVKYNEAVKVATDVFAKAVPPFEKGRELRPDDIDTLTSLKELYYRLKMNDKYNEVMAKLAEMENR